MTELRPYVEIPESLVSRHLPADAVTLLRAACRTRSMRTIDSAIARVKAKYPDYFHKETENASANR